MLLQEDLLLAKLLAVLQLVNLIGVEIEVVGRIFKVLKNLTETTTSRTEQDFLVLVGLLVETDKQ